MYIEIAPVFAPDDLATNALALCEVSLLRKKEDVPVDYVTIVSDGREVSFAVEPGTYEIALVLFHLMTHSAAPTFELTRGMRRIIAEYFGPTILADAARSSDTEHQTVRALLGDLVFIRLTLKPGYRECLAASRSLEEVIRYAWSRRNSITPESPEPLLRHALKRLFEKTENADIRIALSDDGAWPTPTWADRAVTLQLQLGETQLA